MGYRWYHKRYRPNAFVTDQKGTCRTCGESIYFMFETTYYDKTRRTIGTWVHVGFTEETLQDQDHYPQPKEFCAEGVTAKDYDECGAPVKYEDVQSGNYACGRHMRKWDEDQKWRQRQAEEQERRAAREALEEFEAIQYQTAADWIRANGFGHLIEETYEAKASFSRLVRYSKVEVFVLKEFLEGIVAKLAGVEEDPPPAEAWKDEIANRPPPPWKGYDPEEAM